LLGRVFSSLRTVQWIVAIGALVVGVVAYLAGRPAWVTRTAAAASSQETYDWIAGHSDMLRLGGIGIAVVAFFIVGLELWAIVVIGLLLAGYLWLLSEAGRRSSTPGVPTEDAVVGGDSAD
jgi:hypothetical protein